MLILSINFLGYISFVQRTIAEQPRETLYKMEMPMNNKEGASEVQ